MEKDNTSVCSQTSIENLFGSILKCKYKLLWHYQIYRTQGYGNFEQRTSFQHCIGCDSVWSWVFKQSFSYFCQWPVSHRGVSLMSPKITITGLLSPCEHLSLLKLGCRIMKTFHSSKKQHNLTSADMKEAVANFHPQVLFWKCQVFCSHPINIHWFSNLFRDLL